MNAKLAGSISGFAATVPMTAAMVALHKLLPIQEQAPLPPRQITDHAVSEAGLNQQVHEPERTAVSLLAHFGYGSVAGAGYSAMAGKSGLPPVAEGALYGLAVWGGSYLGLMPATGLYRSATEEPASRNALMITSHLIWGGALGVIFASLTSNSRHKEE